MTENSAEHELVLTRLLNAPREKVYRCWTEEEHIVKWFAPAPWTTPYAKLDVRAGGTQIVTMRSPEGQDYPTNGVYLEVIPNQKAGLDRCICQRLGAVEEALFHRDPDLRGRGREDALHGDCAALDC